MRAVLLSLFVLFPSIASAQELILVDAQGKDVRLKEWKIVFGTRKLPWTNDAGDYLEIREETSTTFQQGIQTFVPLASVKRIDFDADKKTATYHILIDGGKEEKLVGTTGFQGINKLAIETDVSLGDLGQAVATYLGGADRAGLKSIQFPNPKAAVEVPKGTATAIVAHDKAKSAHSAIDLIPLYQVGQAQQTSPFLFFKPAAKVQLSSIVNLKYLPSKDKKQPTVVEVATQDGNRANLQPLENAKLTDQGATGKLIGLAGRVPAGWKVFPLHTIQELKAPAK